MQATLLGPCEAGAEVAKSIIRRELLERLYNHAQRLPVGATWAARLMVLDRAGERGGEWFPMWRRVWKQRSESQADLLEERLKATTWRDMDFVERAEALPPTLP